MRDDRNGERPHESWDERFRRFENLQRAEPGRVDRALGQMAARLPDRGAELAWFLDGLSDERRWFVAALCKRARRVSSALWAPMIRTAVDTRNPSTNRAFVEPCAIARGGGGVVEELLVYLQTGNDEERTGAANALYWAMPFARPDADLATLKARVRRVLLEAFLSTTFLPLKRSALALLDMTSAPADAEQAARLQAVLEQARAHEDAFLRNRVEMKDGRARLIAPLPEW